MPLGNTQRSAMLYASVIFAALFIIATALAVICYIRAEGYRTKNIALQNQVNDLASPKEQQAVGSLIGTKQGSKSRLGAMIGYLNDMVSLIIPGPREETSAEVEVEAIKKEVKNTTERLAKKYTDIASAEPNKPVGLIRIIEKLETKLDNSTASESALGGRLKEVQNKFDDAMAVTREKEKTLLAEKEKYQQQVDNLTQDYNKLKALLEQTSEQRAKSLIAQLDEERNNRKTINQQLLKTQAELKIAEDRIKYIQQELQKLVPPPDSEVAAFKADGRIILIDSGRKTVHINLGSNDHIYRGLTFAVYDKSMPIPREGKGKAEIEVFDVGEKISTARITGSDRKNPIITDDIIANLIWDSSKTSKFVIAGDFDLNGDGVIDLDAADRIKAMIEKWGGKVTDTVSIDADFLLLGTTPEVRQKPTFEETQVDPTAMDRYEISVKRLNNYKEVQNSAKELGIPVINYERFLYLIGYKSQADRAGAF